MIVRQQSTRFSIVKRSKGQSAVDKASYISRETLQSEYDGNIYRPKYHEDLVHSEIGLPENAPEGYHDRATLWNSVEMEEKRGNAQLARMLKATLPNEWTYDQAVEIVRKYINDNFVSQGMCADWAIHDSVNDKGQRNLHFHAMFTMRPIDENGKWGAKSRKVYILDKDGNKIRKKNGTYKCTTETVIDWNDQKKAKEWRTALADIINKSNQEMGLDVKWEHRSFKEQGLDIIPTIHLGPQATALERKGIRTEKGDRNRDVLEIRDLLHQVNTLTAKVMESKPVKAVVKASNEIIDMIRAITNQNGRLKIPVFGGKYIRSISNREALQKPENAIAFVQKNSLENFEQLRMAKSKAESEYDTAYDERHSLDDRIERLDRKLRIFKLYEPYSQVHHESEQLTGWAKRKYDKEHASALREYPDKREMMQCVLDDGEKIAPKAWKAERDNLIGKREKAQLRMKAKVPDLAYMETIEYNQKELMRDLENESHVAQRQITPTHKHREEFL